MGNAALLIDNLADGGTLTASSAASAMPIAQLIDSAHVTDDLWRSTSNSANFMLDLLADVALDTVALLGLTVGASATIRLRVSTSAGGSTSGDLLDTGVLTAPSAWFDPDYGMFVYPSAAPLTGRYVRFDLVDSAASYVEAGRLVVGLREALTYNFAPGSALGWVDPSNVEKSKGGQSLIWQRQGFRSGTLDFQWVTNVQRWDLIETLGRVNGRHTDVLATLDPNADNVPQQTIWGLLTDLSPVAFTAIPDIYTKQFQIEERR